MSTSTSVSSLKIHTLTKAQYDEIQNPSEDELYLVPDTIDSSPTSNSGNPISSGGVYTALSGKADKSEMSVVDGTDANADKTTITLKSGTSATVLKSHQDISGKANSSDLATVATSGSYNDLSNKPDLSQYATEDELYSLPNANGHAYVDLGLPSGTLWATMNVGASAETGYGNYYMYGKGSSTYNSSDTPYAGTEDPLSLSVDTARQVWGGDWHMPTSTQMQELIDNTTYLWVENYNNSGIAGALFTASNNATLFIPASGYYDSVGNDYTEDPTFGYALSSSPYDSWDVYSLFFQEGYVHVDNYTPISGGFPVRPVLEKPEPIYATKTELAQVESSKEEVTQIVAQSTAISTLTAEVGKYYRLDAGVETLSITLPTMTNVTSVKTITFYMTGGTTPATTWTSTHNVYKAKGFEIKTGCTYEVSAAWNGSAWVVTQVEIEIPT